MSKKPKSLEDEILMNNLVASYASELNKYLVFRMFVHMYSQVPAKEFQTAVASVLDGFRMQMKQAVSNQAQLMASAKDQSMLDVERFRVQHADALKLLIDASQGYLLALRAGLDQSTMAHDDEDDE